jgi:hypothetical protein
LYGGELAAGVEVVSGVGANPREQRRKRESRSSSGGVRFFW